MGSQPERPEPEYAALVRRVFPDLESLFEAGDDVTVLMAQPGWNHITRLLDAMTTDIDTRLDGQLLESRAEYARAHGRRAGLRAIAEAARAIVGEAERRRREQSRKHEATAEPVAIGG